MRSIGMVVSAWVFIPLFSANLAAANSAPAEQNLKEAQPPKVEAAEKAPARQPQRLSISILWFEDKTGDPQAVHWRYAIEGMLSIQLGKIKTIRFRSGVESACKRLKIDRGAALDADQAGKIGEIIEAQRVIWGSFQRQGDKWQVTARILNVASGKTSADLTAISANWFEVHDDLTGRILKELNITPSDTERRKMEEPLTSSMDALELYSKAFVLQEEHKPYSELEACARKAIAADPNFTRAYLILASSLLSQGKFEPAEQAVRQALKIEPDSGYAHTVLGVVLLVSKSYTESEKELLEAHRLDPDDTETLNRLGQLYSVQDKLDDAIGAFNEAIAMEPMNASYHACLGLTYAIKRDRAQALEGLKKAEQLDPEGIEEINAEQMICRAYDLLNEIPLAMKHYDRFIMLANNQGLNPGLVGFYEKRATYLKARLVVTFVENPMPKVYSEQMLQETLGTKLTKEELAMVVNPLASNPEIKQWALQLTEAVDGDLGKARAIFDGLLQRISVGDTSGMRTAREVFAARDDTNALFNCQETAKLYIAMARDAGLKAFFTIVDKDYNDHPISHACSAVFVDGKTLLVDLSYHWFGVPHKKVVVMDDLQTITIQLCEAANKGQHRSLCPLAMKLHPDVPASQLTLAMALANADEWQEARRMTEAARQVEPEHWMVYVMQGRLAHQNKDFDMAETYFHKALALKPDDANCRYFLGHVLLAQLNFEEAREEFRAALQYGLEHTTAEEARRAISLINESMGDEKAQISTDPNIYFLRAGRYWSEGLYEKTIVQLNRVLALNPEFTEAYYKRGQAYSKMQQYEQAILDFTKVIEIKPDHTGAYHDRGITHKLQGQFDRAMQDFNKALEIEPQNPQIYESRGNVYFARGQYDQALRDFTRAIEIAPESDDAYGNRADTYFNNGQYDQAISDFTKIIELNPEKTKAYGGRGTAYAVKGQYNQAISDLTKAIEKDTTNAKLYLNRGTSYSGVGQYERAIADYNKAIELDPRLPPSFYYFRGFAYLKTGDDDRAISDFDTVLKDNPRDTKALVGLATVLLKKDLYVMAISVATRAIEIDPKLDRAYDIRARAYYKNGKFQESWNDVEKAQEMGFEFEPAFLESLRAARKEKQ